MGGRPGPAAAMIGTRAEDLPTIHQNVGMVAVREYVTARDATRYDGQAPGSLRLDVTHSNLVQRWHDILFDERMTIGAVKEKLYRHGGTSVAHQELYLRRGGNDTIFLMEESQTLKYYGAMNGMEIHIKDTDPYSLSKHGGLEDVSQVKKYMMDDEDYDKLENSVRAAKRREQLKGAEATGEQEVDAQALTEEELRALAEHFAVGSRCEVAPGGRRGEVGHCGKVVGVKGVWVGIRLDEPQGSNDGTKDGARYFDCPGPKYGCFARPEHVTVGDFPPLDPFASDEEF